MGCPECGRPMFFEERGGCAVCAVDEMVRQQDVGELASIAERSRRYYESLRSSVSAALAIRAVRIRIARTGTVVTGRANRNHVDDSAATASAQSHE